MEFQPKRRKTRMISLRGVPIGSEAPIVVQSMTNTDTRDIDATCAQIQALVDGGCEIVRVAVIDAECVDALKTIRKKIDRKSVV